MKTRLAALLLCALPHLAFAQMVYGPATITSGTISGTVRVTPNGQAETSLGAALAAAVGACPTSGCTFSGAVNTSSALGYQQNGVTVMNTGISYVQPGFGPAPQQALFLGQGAGAAFPLNAAGDWGTLGVGTNALRSLTVQGTEASAFGQSSCEYVATGSLFTCLGMHALGAATTAVGDTALGNDAERDAFPQNYTVAIGQHAMAHGMPGNGVIGIGAQTLRGNSGAIILAGTKTTGDTITVTMTTATAGLTGFPYSGTYTVLAGDTLATIAAGISNMVNAATLTGPSYSVGTEVKAYGTTKYAISFYFPGTQTLGWAITIGATSSGTETVAVINGSNPTNTTVIGANSVAGNGMSAVDELTVVGSGTGGSIQTTTRSVLLGDTVAPVMTGSNATTLVGSRVGQLMINPSLITVIGAAAYGAAVSPSNTTVIGANVGGTCVSGNNVLLIGFNAAVDCPAGATTGYANIVGAFIQSLVAPTISSGFGTSPTVPNGATSAAFEVNVGTGGAASAGVIAFATGAAHGWSCSAADKTNPATSNTVATPTSTTTVTLTNYSRTTGVATAWAASDVITVMCNGY